MGLAAVSVVECRPLNSVSGSAHLPSTNRCVSFRNFSFTMMVCAPSEDAPASGVRSVASAAVRSAVMFGAACYQCSPLCPLTRTTPPAPRSAADASGGRTFAALIGDKFSSSLSLPSSLHSIPRLTSHCMTVLAHRPAETAPSCRPRADTTSPSALRQTPRQSRRGGQSTRDPAAAERHAGRQRGGVARRPGPAPHNYITQQ